MAQKYGFELETYGLTESEISDAITSVAGEAYYGHFYYHGSRSLGLRSKENGMGNLWVSENDGSIDYGYEEEVGDTDHEVISPIVEGREGIETVCRVVNALRRAGAKFNDNCSIHLTFGMENSSARWNRMSAKKKAKVIVKLVEFFQYFQDGIMTLLPARRNPTLSSHARTYCMNSRVNRANDRLGLPVGNAQAIVRDMIDHERGAINVTNLFSKGIIEFRSLEMTFDTHRIRTWALLMHKILSYCVTSVSNGQYEAFSNNTDSLEGLLFQIKAGKDLINDCDRMACKNLLQEFGMVA